MNALIGLAFLTIIIRIGFNFIVGGHNITYAINDGDQVFRVHETLLLVINQLIAILKINLIIF